MTGRPAAPIAVIPKNKLQEIRVWLSDYKGHDRVNIRVWAERQDGSTERIPTKAGVAYNVTLLPALIEALRKAEIAAREAGLLPPAFE